MKSTEAYRTIGEVSQVLEVEAHVLRFWEGKFSQIKPIKRSGKRRYYRKEDIYILKKIKTMLYEEGYTIKGVQKYFSNNKLENLREEGKGKLGFQIQQQLEEVKDELLKIKKSL